MNDKKALDCFGNVIEVGDWAIYKNNQTKGLPNSRDWFEVGVVTKINDKLITLESMVADESAPNRGEGLRQIRKLPYHICLFKKVRLPDLWWSLDLQKGVIQCREFS